MSQGSGVRVQGSGYGKVRVQGTGYWVQGSGYGVRGSGKMNEPLKNFKELRVWQRAYELSLLIYNLTKKFPKEELCGLVSQMRRASVSIASNIAEGYSRKGRSEYIQFLSIAYGSLSELETQTLLSKDLKYLSDEEFTKVIAIKDQVGGMLYKLMQRLRAYTEPCTPKPVP